MMKVCCRPFDRMSECVDTAGFDNGWGYGCDYYRKHFCEDDGPKSGSDWVLGSFYNHPENNCCGCGKPHDAFESFCWLIVITYCLPLILSSAHAILYSTCWIRGRCKPAKAEGSDGVFGSGSSAGSLQAGLDLSWRAKIRNAIQPDAPQIISWPPSVMDSLDHPIFLTVYSLLLVLAYYVVQWNSGGDCTALCRRFPPGPYEENHGLNIIELLGRGALLFWIADVPAQARAIGHSRFPGVVFTIVLSFNYALTHTIQGDCAPLLQTFSLSTSQAANSTTTLSSVQIILVACLVMCNIALVCLAVLHLRAFSLLRFAGAFSLAWFIQSMIVIGVGGYVGHLHHYHNGMILGLFCGLPHFCARLTLIYCVTQLAEGIAVWGADPVLMKEGDSAHQQEGVGLSAVLFGLLYVALVVGTLVKTYSRHIRGKAEAKTASNSEEAQTPPPAPSVADDVLGLPECIDGDTPSQLRTPTRACLMSQGSARRRSPASEAQAIGCAAELRGGGAEL